MFFFFFFFFFFAFSKREKIASEKRWQLNKTWNFNFSSVWTKPKTLPGSRPWPPTRTIWFAAPRFPTLCFRWSAAKGSGPLFYLIYETRIQILLNEYIQFWNSQKSPWLYTESCFFFIGTYFHLEEFTLLQTSEPTLYILNHEVTCGNSAQTK
jgi:hypothetical protein